MTGRAGAAGEAGDEDAVGESAAGADTGEAEAEALREELQAAAAEIERLERETAIAAAQAQQAAHEADALREELRQAQESRDAQTAELRHETEAAAERAREGASRYRELMLRMEPSLPPDLVAGETVDEVDASIATARVVVGSVRAHIAGLAEAARAPAGAPARGAPDLSSMTPAQKIALGLRRRDE